MSAIGKRRKKAEQFAFLEKALTCGWVTGFSLAVDGGANVGTWAIRMAQVFGRVHAFEPAPEIYTKLLYAVAPHINVQTFRLALLDRKTKVRIIKPEGKKALRSLYVQESNLGTEDSTDIDSLALPSLGFLKLDLEGAEYPALRGAKRTIARFRPTLMVEMDKLGRRFGRTLEETEALIASMGYVEVGRSRPDRCYIPVERT